MREAAEPASLGRLTDIHFLEVKGVEEGLWVLGWLACKMVTHSVESAAA